MSSRLDSEQEPAPVRLPVEQQETEQTLGQVPERPATLLSSASVDGAIGLVVGAVPLTLFVVGNSHPSGPLLPASALLLLVLCLLYFLPLRPYRALRCGLLVGMALLTGGYGLLVLFFSTPVFLSMLNALLEPTGLGIFDLPRFLETVG